MLTIESETFISDLRIRPVKQIFEPTFTSSSWTNNSYGNGNSESLQYYDSQNSLKLTWNLEIRRLKKEDSAFYYCVLNSENAYGQIYKLNVLRNENFQIYIYYPLFRFSYFSLFVLKLI